MEAEGGFELVSRESFLLANNVLLVGATFAILFGTLYPVFIDALVGEKMSVGSPWFDAFFVLFMLPLAVLLGFGMHAAWKRTNLPQLAGRLRWGLIAAFVLAITVPIGFYGGGSLLTMFASFVGLWVCFAALVDPVRRIVLERRRPHLPLSQWGMIVAHFGLGLFILGATYTSAYNLESDHAVSPGETWDVGGYAITFTGTRAVDGPNYEATEGVFELRKNGTLITTMRPQERIYTVRREPMTEAAIDGRIQRDVFIALGQQIGSNPETWSVRVRVKPLIRFIWYGAFVMAIGGIIAISDRRYRQTAKSKARVAVTTGQPIAEH
jgi:cytochrome c-type biogenesis protein CcmF